MSDDEAPIRPDYESQTLRLADLAVTDAIIAGKTFSNCHLVGPMMLVMMNGNTVSGCSFPGTADEVVIVVDQDRRIFGAVGVQQCEFFNCRFTDIGFIGSEVLLAQFRSGMSE